MKSVAVRNRFLPYCLPLISDEEVQEVADVIRSGWLTTGPRVRQFEHDFADYVGVRRAIAVNSCTAGLLLALKAQGIGPGDEVLVPTLTFCSTANVVLHLGAKPVLVDIDEHGFVSVKAAANALTNRTRGIIPVHYAGQACNLDQILDFVKINGLHLVEDGAHASGTEFRGQKVGSHGEAVAFSFYVTKNMTTGEGGMITTNDDALADRMRLLSLHGITKDAWNRYEEHGSWYYEVVEPGYKANMTDIQAALGIHQLRRLDGFIRRRREIAAQYQAAFADLQELRLPGDLPGRSHTYHLYPIHLDLKHLRIGRAEFIEEMHRANIGASVHFVPLHRQPYYRDTFGYRPEQFPVAERFYAGQVSLPLYPKMTEGDVRDVVATVRQIVETWRR